MRASMIALSALALLLALAPGLTVPADAETRTRCLTREQQRIAIAERRAVPLVAVRRALRSRLPGELVSARLCQESGRLIYLLTVLPRDGKVRRVTIDARSGAIITIR